MMAAVGSESSFLRGRQQLQLLAGLEVSTKAVERHAEAIGNELSAGNRTKGTAWYNWSSPASWAMPSP
jgi:hypothetical protein